MGGDSSTGKGRYKLEIQENFPVKKAEKPSLWLNLATYHPLQDEWDYFKKPGDLTYYQIATKRGLVEQWLQRSTIKLKELLLIIKEGSTFPLIPDKYSYGSLVIVQQSENGKVYQYGYAFPLWI
ncbi:hypothetical protein [Candidatus Hakubella thermalkaliphila]|uniref:Csm4 C-terminal domain-containing protein n=1 Tax=Candidatus Hakubella thermalkaliphila TaxID=2754717 RepID=A0A6V8P7G7_9ACTN|nr:hypothetical protein [Candidatus Hakubella thermalkaliphila]GFP28585.1 hypothetical protein HKBW3S33_01999 [Candidatus Hakubella thermalkaliphila]